VVDAEFDRHSRSDYATAPGSRRNQILRYLLEHPELDAASPRIVVCPLNFILSSLANVPFTCSLPGRTCRGSF
jgi:hypothetical protein